MPDFKTRLKELRIKKGIMQSEMAKFLGVSIQSYSAYETGREPKYEYLIKLSEYFNVTTDYLLGVSSIKDSNDKANLSQSLSDLKIYAETDKHVKDMMIKLSYIFFIQDIIRKEDVNLELTFLLHSVITSMLLSVSLLLRDYDLIKHADYDPSKYIDIVRKLNANIQMCNSNIEMYHYKVKLALNNIIDISDIDALHKDTISKIHLLDEINIRQEHKPIKPDLHDIVDEFESSYGEFLNKQILQNNKEEEK